MKILTIHSFAVHGTASMKAVLSLLGTRVLPVPSLYLTGLTNIDGFIKTQTAFEELFMGSLRLARQRRESVLLFIGYLGSRSQVECILHGIQQYQDIIQDIIVDPVSGDHGKLYVPKEVWESWPSLLEKANWALPNYTELQLHSGLSMQEDIPAEAYIDAFRKRFPHLSFIATSLPHPEKMLLHLSESSSGNIYTFTHQRLSPAYSGTGDTFAAYFIYFCYIKGNLPQRAMELAALSTVQIIHQSTAKGSKDLIIELI